MAASTDMALPLVRMGYFDGRSPHGRAVPYFLPGSEGVVLTSPSALALHDHSLAARKWSLGVLETADGFWEQDGRLYYGSTPKEIGGERQIIEVVLQTGQATTIEIGASVERFVGVNAVTVLMRFKDEGVYWLRARDRVQWRELWREQTHAEMSAAQSTDRRYFVPTQFGARLRCLDALTGACLWDFEPPGRDPSKKVLDQWNRIGTGFPSVVVVGDRVIVTTLDCQVYALSVETGELLAHGRPPFRGAYQVTERSVFFKQAFGLSEFDHREMREVDRIEYRAEVEPLYRGTRPTANAFWLNKESVIWTTMHGALMGVSRKPEAGGRRRVWLEEIPGAIMPIAQSPVGYNGYLYYAAASNELDGPMGLYCYKGSEV
jgi:hypothetical protein